jgi:hypothetical protein
MSIIVRAATGLGPTKWRCQNPACCAQNINPYCGVWGCVSCNRTGVMHLCKNCGAHPSDHRQVHCRNPPISAPSSAVGCYVLKRDVTTGRWLILVHRRSKQVRNGLLISGPGGSVDNGHTDKQALDNEMTEETLGGKPTSIKWHLFNAVQLKTGNVARSYVANGTGLTIAGPDKKHEWEVDLKYQWDDLAPLVAQYAGGGHAWLDLHAIAALQQPLRDKFLWSFWINCQLLDTLQLNI